MLFPMLQGSGGECGLRGGYVEMNNIHPNTLLLYHGDFTNNYILQHRITSL
jgi:hypothetical protein